MRVGVHKAIHGVGLDPSTMNSGVQTAFVLYGAISNLHHSCGHFNFQTRFNSGQTNTIPTTGHHPIGIQSLGFQRNFFPF